MSLSLKDKMERPKHALVQPMESSLEALHAERYQLHHLSLVALFGGSQKLFSCLGAKFQYLLTHNIFLILTFLTRIIRVLCSC